MVCTCGTFQWGGGDTTEVEKLGQVSLLVLKGVS